MEGDGGMRERSMDIERRKCRETAEGKQSVGPRNRQTGDRVRVRDRKKERERIKETTTEAQSPLSPPSPYDGGVWCWGSGTTSYSTAPF